MDVDEIYFDEDQKLEAYAWLSERATIQDVKETSTREKNKMGFTIYF